MDDNYAELFRAVDKVIADSAEMGATARGDVESLVVAVIGYVFVTILFLVHFCY